MRVDDVGVAERDQECEKSELNGTAIDTWAFNPRFSFAACVAAVEDDDESQS